MPPKTITYRSYKNFTEEQFKEAIRWDCSYNEGGWQLNFSSTCNWKKALSICSYEKDRLRGKNKPHTTSQLRKAIMKWPQFKNKANKSGKPSDKTAYKTWRKLVVKLDKEAKKSFLKNQVTEYAIKNKILWKLSKTYFTEKMVFIVNRNLLLKLRVVTSNETTIAYIFNNYFVNIT